MGGCISRVKNTCPLQNQCQTQNLMHRANVENEVNDEAKIYFRLAVTTFKKWFGNHKKDFKYRPHSKNTELSNCIWSLKDAKITYHNIKWSVAKKNSWGNKN